MDHPQRRIAVPHRIHNDTHREQIIDLVYRLILVLHLLVNTEEMLDPSVNLCSDPRMFYMLRHLIHDRLDILLAVAFADGNLVDQIIVCLRLQIFQRQIIQFHLDPGYAKPLRNGGIDI